MLLLALALYGLLKREGLWNRATLGYGLPRAKFLKQLGLGWIAGSVLMLPLVFTLFALDVRIPVSFTTALIASAALKGAFAGLLIALIEETFMRGAMYSVIERESGVRYALLLPAILYAAVHFMDGKLRIPAADMDFIGGLRMAAHILERFVDPLEILDSFLALFALGLLLALTRLRTGAIAGAIGLHAGGVCVIAILREISVVNTAAPAAWLVGSYDGVIGWLACAWIGVITLVYWRLGKR